MTREEILKMEPGPELDRLVAEKVMGWEENREFEMDPHGVVKVGEIIDLWSPSADIAAAWEVVEALKSRGFVVQVTTHAMLSQEPDAWACNIWFPEHQICLLYTSPSPRD